MHWTMPSEVLSAITTPHVQVVAALACKPVPPPCSLFPCRGCHSTAMKPGVRNGPPALPEGAQSVTKPSGLCFPDFSHVQLLPCSLAARSLCQPVIICLHSTLPGTRQRLRIYLLNERISRVKTLSVGTRRTARLSG